MSNNEFQGRGSSFMSATSKIDRHVWNERDAIVSVGIWQKISTFREIIQLIAHSHLLSPAL